MLRWPLMLVYLGLAACIIGCGGGAVSAPTGEVQGVVTYQGKPVPDVNVTFTPDKGRPGYGTTDAQGKFTISTFGDRDGAVPGTHKVTITDTREIPMPGTPEAEQAANTPPPFPPKYSDPAQSDLTADVKEGQVNEVTLTLSD
jgi:hypothetical protein